MLTNVVILTWSVWLRVRKLGRGSIIWSLAAGCRHCAWGQVQAAVDINNAVKELYLTDVETEVHGSSVTQEEPLTVLTSSRAKDGFHAWWHVHPSLLRALPSLHF